MRVAPDQLQLLHDGAAAGSSSGAGAGADRGEGGSLLGPLAPLAALLQSG